MDGVHGGEPPEPAGEASPSARTADAHEALALVQAWLADERLAGARLVVLTRGAVAAHARRAGVGPGGSAGVGAGALRSVRAPRPRDARGPRRRACLVAGAAGGARGRGPVADRRAAGAARRRGARPAADAGERRRRAGSAGGGLAVASGGGESGTLEDLRLVGCPEVDEPLAEGQVRVAVRAASVNFRDVVSALGLVPLRGAWDAIGSDGAGVVMEVGPRGERAAARRPRDGAAARCVRPGGGDRPAGRSCGCPRAGRLRRPRRSRGCS